MAQAKGGKTEPVAREAVNQVHKEAILAETVRKENDSIKLYTKYSVNPVKKQHIIAGKITSVQEQREREEFKEDSQFLELIARANLEPTKKYIQPQTEAQEIGWITTPLLEKDVSDTRLHFPRKLCEMTKFMHQFWLEEEQKKMNDGKK